MTIDSTACIGCCSTRVQTPQSTADPRQPRQHWPLLAGMRPRRSVWKCETACRSALVRSTTPPSSRWLTARPTQTIRPLRSTRVTRLPHYYGAARPCAVPRYSALAVAAAWGPPVATLGRGPSPRPTVAPHDDRFPRSTPEPEPGSRHLYAGRHLSHTQVALRYISQEPWTA